MTEENLKVLFEGVFDLYTKCDNVFEEHYRVKNKIPQPESLVSLMQEDWNIFNGELLDNKNIAKVIYNISPEIFDFSSEALASVWYRESDRYYGYFTNKDWEIFCNNIKHKCRFNYNDIDENGFDPNQVFDKELFGYAHNQIKKGMILYRARDGYIIDKVKGVIKPFPPKKMGIPNNRIISNGGRANPPGINYLYTSDDISTVLSEIRAWKGSINSVAKIAITKDLEIFDLTNKFEIISPFFTMFSSLRKEIEVISILNAFANDLSKPVNPNISAIDYIPTQYICELIKVVGFEGIKFKSSLGNGNNIIFFTDENVRIREVKLVQVKNISYESDEYVSQV
ncbi:RES family NAD+ phosphorylase [Desulfosporosinus sp. BG]|uniref:RES family NAD+ phosphorylase n=1 Tax=Desulfosporosinus sp. BG TaxID=1633135 RepID=UPI00114C932C|nr:RES family NAD+ phosphorylase [Desulfosporosinus sp. BG]